MNMVPSRRDRRGGIRKTPREREVVGHPAARPARGRRQTRRNARLPGNTARLRRVERRLGERDSPNREAGTFSVRPRGQPYDRARPREEPAPASRSAGGDFGRADGTRCPTRPQQSSCGFSAPLRKSVVAARHQRLEHASGVGAWIAGLRPSAAVGVAPYDVVVDVAP